MYRIQTSIDKKMTEELMVYADNADKVQLCHLPGAYSRK